MKEVRSKNKGYVFLYRFLIKTGVLLVGIAMVLIFVICPFRMNDNTMFPSFRNGDLGIFCKLMSCQTNDIILYEDSNGKLKVGRIVAVGGQTVVFNENGGFQIDGYTPSEEIPYETYADNVSNYPLVLTNDQFFVLNDFRSIQTDSRQFGPIDKSQIKGKLVFLWRIRGF